MNGCDLKNGRKRKSKRARCTEQGNRSERCWNVRITPTRKPKQKKGLRKLFEHLKKRLY